MSSSVMRGRFVVVEGLDGVGKSTASQVLAARLGAWWETTSRSALREAPGASNPVVHCLGYALTVLDVGREATARIAAGEDVVLDRYWLTTLAYAPRDAGDALRELGRLVPAPDLTLYLWAPLSLRQARLAGRGALSGADRATLDPAEDRRLHRTYRALAAHPAAGALVQVDASGSAEQVLADMVGAVRAYRPAQPLLFA